MEIQQPTLLQIQNEGITMVDNLEKFDKETQQQITDNLRRPGVRILYPNYIPPALMHVPALIVPMVPTPPFIFGKSPRSASK